MTAEEAIASAETGSSARHDASRYDVPTDDLKQRALRGGVTKVSAQGALFVVRLGSLVALARLLEPADFGLVNMVTVVTGLFGLFRDAGLSLVTVQRAAITEAQVSALFWLNLLVGTALAALSVGVAPALVAFYDEPRLFWVAVAVGSGFLFNAAGVQHMALLQRRMRFAALGAIELGASVVSVAIGILMAISGYGHWSLVGMSVVLPLASSAAAWAVAGWVPGRPRRGVGLASMARFGGIVSVNGLLMYVAYNTDKLLLGRFAGATTLGLYGRAFQVVNVPTEILHQSVSKVAISVLSRLQGDTGRLASYFVKGYAFFVAATLPIAVACALFADDIVAVLLGPRWSTAAQSFRLLSPTVVAFALINPVGWFLFATGQVERALRMSFVIAPVLIASYAAGLPYGPAGVAIGFSAGMTVLVVPLIVWGFHGSAIAPREVGRTIRPAAAAALLAAMVTIPTVYWFCGSASPLPRLACEAGLFAVSYLLLLLYPMRQKEFYVRLFKDFSARR